MLFVCLFVCFSHLGMIPHKTKRGSEAMNRLKVFDGVPPPYDKVLSGCYKFLSNDEGGPRPNICTSNKNPELENLTFSHKTRNIISKPKGLCIAIVYQ